MINRDSRYDTLLYICADLPIMPEKEFIIKKTGHFFFCKTFLMLSALFFVFVNIAASQGISTVKQILKNIRPPEFKKVTYSIASFGAVPDGRTDTKAMIDKAI